MLKFWKRFSLVGFAGVGTVWNVGVDLAFAPDNTAVYLQMGSAWTRP